MRRAATPDVEAGADGGELVALASARSVAGKGGPRPSRVGRRVDPRVRHVAAVAAAAVQPQMVVEGRRRVLVPCRRLEARDGGAAKGERLGVEDDEVVHEDAGRVAAKEVDRVADGRRAAARPRRELLD